MNLKLSVLLFCLAIIGLLSCKQDKRSSGTPIETNIKVEERFELADGASLGAAGPYEVLRIRIEGSLDVKHPAYSKLNDAKLWSDKEGQFAPYATTMLIFRPIDSTKANGTVLFEWPNRGNTFALGLFNEARPPRRQRADEPSATLAEIPKTPREFGNKFLFNRGYTLVWAGWETNTYRRSGIFAELPIYDAGKPIEVTEELAVGFRAKSEATALPLMFDAVTNSSIQATLTKRMPSGNVQLETTSFTITDEDELSLLAADGTPKTFDRGVVYQLKYFAQKYPLSGLGLAIMNEVALGIKKQGALAKISEWMPQKETTPNIIALGASQPGRALRTLARKLPNVKGFDGHFILAGGAGQSLIDMPFAQTSKTATAFYDSFLPEFLEEGPLLLEKDGPKVMEIHTSSEYWQKIAFLTHAKKDGTSRDLSTNHRIYHLTGTQHSGGNGIRSTAGPCLFQRNLSKPTPIIRALFTAMDDWTTKETLPPPTTVPNLEDGSLVVSDAINYSAIFGIKNPMPHSPTLFDKDVPTKKLTTIFLPKIDPIGNEKGGILPPAISVPLSTRTGWNIDKQPDMDNCLCHQYGSYFPLAINKENKNASDFRPSITELYADELTYTNKIEKEINQLILGRYLLAQEKESLINAAKKQYQSAINPRK